MITSLGSDYVRTARAKGLTERQVVLHHALRNSLITVVTILGLELGALISGSVVTESIFLIPGFGRLIIEAVQRRDYPVIQGVALVSAVAYILINFIVDVLYSLLNPRVRVTRASGMTSTALDPLGGPPGSRASPAGLLSRPPAAIGLVIAISMVLVAHPRSGHRALPARGQRLRGDPVAPDRRRIRSGRTSSAATSCLASCGARGHRCRRASLATLIAVLVVAVPIGLVAGFYRGLADTLVMRVTDACWRSRSSSSPSAWPRSWGRRS